MRSDKYDTMQEAADHFGVTVRTIRNWASAGKFPIYKLPSGRGLRVRIPEIEQAVRRLPTAQPTPVRRAVPPTHGHAPGRHGYTSRP